MERSRSRGERQIGVGSDAGRLWRGGGGGGGRGLGWSPVLEVELVVCVAVNSLSAS